MMRLRAAILASILGLGAVACEPARQETANTSPVHAELGDPFTLEPGQQAAIDEADLYVRFVEVTDDSRCPVGAQCPWAGNARVRIRLEQGGAPPAEAELNTMIEPRARTVGAYRLELIDLVPEPRPGESVPAGSYRSVLRVMLAPTG